MFVHGVHGVKSLYAADKPLWVYVVEGDRTLWVDVGINRTPDEVVMPYLVSRAELAWNRPQIVAITHADVDHFGGIRRLRASRADSFVMAHAADKLWIESPAHVMRERYAMHTADAMTLTDDRVAILAERGGGGGKIDFALSGGEEIDLGEGGVWRVLHTPGHTPGHIILWCEKRRCAIIGDAVLDWGVFDDHGKLIAPPPYYAVEDYLQTIATLEELDVETMFTSHYGILDRARSARLLANSRQAVHLIDKALSAALAERSEGWTLADLCARTGELAEHWAPGLWPGLADPISAHLAQGIKEGRVERIAAISGTRQYRCARAV